MNIIAYETYLKSRLTPKRFEHSLGVMRTIGELARLYRLDPYQATVAGLLHDIAKELPPSEWRPILGENELILRDTNKYDYAHYLHGPAGAIVARRDLELGDEEILGAIATHGYYGSWEEFKRPLAWCLRLADILEPGRDWTNNDWLKDIVAPLREAAESGRLMEAALLISERIIVWYESTGISVHPNLRRVTSHLVFRQEPSDENVHKTKDNQSKFDDRTERGNGGKRGLNISP